MRMPWTRRLTTHLALALGLVWATDRLLDDTTLGSGCALVLGVAALAMAVRGLPSPRARPALALALLYALAAAGGLAVTGSVFALLAAAGGVVLVSITARCQRRASPRTLLRGIVASAPRVVLTAAVDTTTLIRLKRHGRTGWPVLTLAMRWAIPVAGGALFLGLFMHANPVVAQVVARCWRWLTQDGWPSLGRVGEWMLAAALSWMLLRARWRIRRPPGADAAPMSDHSALAIRCMLIFNLVFLLHNALDAAYLRGGHALPTGTTYARYAQQGSHTLLITALLAAAIMLLWFRPGSPLERSRPARALLFIWLAQNVVVLLGAAYRLWRYVEVFGLTRWRCCAALWMALVVVGLLLIGWRIFRSWDNGWLIDANLSVLAMVVLVLGWCDADSVIAWQNVRQLGPGPAPGSAEEHRPDIAYLSSLGASAVPALDWLGHQHPATSTGQESRQAVVNLLAQLRADSRDWRARTLRSQALLRSYPTP